MPAGAGACAGEPRTGRQQRAAHLQFTRRRAGGQGHGAVAGGSNSPAHALQGLGEDLRGHAVLVLQDRSPLKNMRTPQYLCSQELGTKDLQQSPQGILFLTSSCHCFQPRLQHMGITQGVSETPQAQALPTTVWGGALALGLFQAPQ